MKLKKVSSMILAVTLACTMTVTPVLADEVSDLKQKKQETQNQVSDLQTQLNSLMTKISDLENDLIETGEEISQTEEDLKTAQEEQEQQYAAMKLRIKYMYEEGTGTATVEKVLTSGDISSVLTQAEYSQQVHSYDRDKLEEYVATVQKVEDLKTTLETKMADLQETQTEYDAQKDELNTTITEKSSEIANLDVKIDEAVKKAAEEEAKRKAAEEAARKAAEEAARKAAEAAAKVPSSSSITTPAAVKKVGLKVNKTFTAGNYKYKVTKRATTASQGAVSVVGLTKKGAKAKKLSVASSVKNKKIKYRVTGIRAKAFKGAKATSVTLNKNINKIPSAAFVNCKKLKTLTVPAKLKKVSKGAFKGCKKKIKVKGASAKVRKANVKLLKKSGYKKFK